MLKAEYNKKARGFYNLGLFYSRQPLAESCFFISWATIRLTYSSRPSMLYTEVLG